MGEAIVTMKLARILWTTALVAACSGSAVTSPTQQPTATPVVTEGPQLFGGSGVITFGRSYDPDTLEITGPTSVFKASTKKIAWSAALSEAANAGELTIVIARVRSSGTETLIDKENFDVSNPDSDVFAGAEDLAAIVGRKAGDYVMRYLRGSTVLAEGRFSLTN